MTDLIKISIQAAINAGEKIMEVYAEDFTVETKADNSPLTKADRMAHEVIKDALADTGYPLLSEEGKQLAYDERKPWKTFWLVDPLDGTKEFIKKNGEFTVNIALIDDGYPVLGVVYVPVTRQVFYAEKSTGSFKFTLNGSTGPDAIDAGMQLADKLPVVSEGRKYTVVASRSHLSPETEVFIEKKKEQHGDIEMISAGSSLKLCLVAEGKAEVYPRLAPTMEWDTAAGHAVAKFAGCKTYNYETGEELQYNKENLLNPWFVIER